MDFNQVRYFLALADSLNFTRAAEHCYVTQPALTQAIQRLEDELGGQLLYRTGRNTELSELGKRTLDQFKQIDTAKHILKATAKAVLSGEVAELHIGIMCTIGPRVLGRLLDQFQKQHPTVALVLHDVSPDATSDLLLTGKLDGVFCARHNDYQTHLRYFQLFEEQMVIAFPPGHRFAKLDAVPLREVSTQKYVDRVLCEFREEFSNIFQDEKLHLNISFSSQREDWIQSMIRDGMGVCLIPRYSLLIPELEHRPIKDPTLSRNVEFAVIEQPVSAPALNMLIKYIEDYDWGTLY